MLWKIARWLKLCTKRLHRSRLLSALACGRYFRDPRALRFYLRYINRRISLDERLNHLFPIVAGLLHQLPNFRQPVSYCACEN